MTDEKKQEFTRRITQANKSQLVVILYDLFFYYIDEAKERLSQGDPKEFGKELDRAHACLNELIGSLHMEQPLAQSIYRVYLFVSGQLGLAKGKGNDAPLTDAVRLMRKLYETYKADAACDTSGPVMGNVQTVIAGMTYGRSDVTESCQASDYNRGFLA